MAPRPTAWWEWRPDGGGREYTVGIEEEAMLLDPERWTLSHRGDSVLPSLPPQLRAHVTPETHGSAVELATGVHQTAGAAARELGELRTALQGELGSMGVRAASAGTHPFAVWQDTVVSSGHRYQFLYGSMRELARREPTFALHVHVGIADPENAIRLVNRLRAHLPLLLALSVNSPFWQGRDSGLASARTPLFQAFPRVGIPRQFRDYDDYVGTVDLLIRSEALPEPTFLWWDVRPQPRFGTVEVRIMDAQTTAAETGALAALVQSLARLEIEDGYASERALEVPEALIENRFLAARDGMGAELIDVDRESRIPVRQQASALLEECAPHAAALGCERELARIADMARETGAQRQIREAREPDRLPGLVRTLADRYAPD